MNTVQRIERLRPYLIPVPLVSISSRGVIHRVLDDVVVEVLGAVVNERVVNRVTTSG